jgi:hypothetical protein
LVSAGLALRSEFRLPAFWETQHVAADDIHGVRVPFLHGFFNTRHPVNPNWLLSSGRMNGSTRRR